MQQYLDLVKTVLEQGVDMSDRTGVGTRSVFGYQMRFDLSKGFPAVTTKRLAWKAVVGELLWFLEGSTDERRLAELTFGKPRRELVGKPTIWTANANKQGVDLGYRNDDDVKELGPVYAAQWRNFDYYTGSVSGVDQISNVINLLKSAPDSRRIIFSSWNPILLDEMALPPCHVMAQFRVLDGKLSCQMYQRSADIGLGVPFNIASYALLTHMLARECRLGVGEYIHTIGDAHIYLNHLDAMGQLLARDPLPLPILEIDSTFDLNVGLRNKFSNDSVHMFTLKNYVHHPEIRMHMAV